MSISQSETVRLQKLAEANTIRDMNSYFAGIATDAARHLVRLEPAGRTGIVWRGGSQVVTALIARAEFGAPIFVAAHRGKC